MIHESILLAALAGAVYPPHQDEFVNDFAKVLEPDDAARIRSTAKASLDRGVPSVVATIGSLADQGAAGWSIERYATNLYNEWGIVIYVSLFERTAAVLGDPAVDQALAKEDYGAIRDVLIEGLRTRRIEEALAGAVRKAGEILARKLPRAPDDKPEIANSLRLLD